MPRGERPGIIINRAPRSFVLETAIDGKAVDKMEYTSSRARAISAERSAGVGVPARGR